MVMLSAVLRRDDHRVGLPVVYEVKPLIIIISYEVEVFFAYNCILCFRRM